MRLQRTVLALASVLLSTSVSAVACDRIDQYGQCVYELGDETIVVVGTQTTYIGDLTPPPSPSAPPDAAPQGSVGTPYPGGAFNGDCSPQDHQFCLRHRPGSQCHVAYGRYDYCVELASSWQVPYATVPIGNKQYRCVLCVGGESIGGL